MISLFDVKVQEIPSGSVPQGYVPVGVVQLKAPKVWPTLLSLVGNVVVGVIDSGLDANHGDLQGSVIGGVNFTTDYAGDRNNFADNHGHGTHCAGTVGGTGAVGVKGMAPGVKLLAIKVLGGSGSGENDWVAQGINWLVDYKIANPTKFVIGSLSLGSTAPHAGTETALKRAVANGVPLICAAGNSGSNTISYPAYYEDAVAVGAIMVDGQPAWWFSSSNDQVDLAAPGVDVLSCKPGGGYVQMTGTSMAAPHVSGFAALVACHFKSRHNRWPSEMELYGLMKYLTHDVLYGDGVSTGTVGPDKFTGAGVVSFAPHDKVKFVKYWIGQAYKDVTIDGVTTRKPLDQAPIVDPATNRSLLPARTVAEDDAGGKLTWIAAENAFTIEYEV